MRTGRPRIRTTLLPPRCTFCLYDEDRAKIKKMMEIYYAKGERVSKTEVIRRALHNLYCQLTEQKT